MHTYTRALGFMVVWSLAACKGAPPAAVSATAPTSATAAATAPATTATPAPAAATPAPATTATSVQAAAPAPAPEAAPLAVGTPAPDVTLRLADGKSLTLASLRGSRVLVYFYPKDDTPGCTTEAVGLRDRWADLQAAGVQVFGVSLQGADSHKAFADKLALPFPLVVDTDATLAAAFHVPVKTVAVGQIAMRQSFLVGKDGRIEAVWTQVDPSTHAADVLAAVAAAVPAKAP